MNSKFFVPFETAKQLKEKGYNNKVDYYYMPNGQRCLGATEVSNDTLDYGNNGTIAAPTYYEVIDWLEGKEIYITCYAPVVTKDVRHYTGRVFNKPTNEWRLSATYHTHEEALNAAILKALEII